MDIKQCAECAYKTDDAEGCGAFDIRPDKCWACATEAQKAIREAAILLYKRDAHNESNRISAARIKRANREKGCAYCEDNAEPLEMGTDGCLLGFSYCPMCGKRLEVEQDG